MSDLIGDGEKQARLWEESGIAKPRALPEAEYDFIKHWFLTGALAGAIYEQGECLKIARDPAVFNVAKAIRARAKTEEVASRQ